ncbi:MAG: T9SS type A sorting domain-containing protein, partial [Bacteroidetes bacterium]
DHSNMEFELIDAGSGRIIKKSSIEQSILTVDTKVEPGVYFIRILKEGALVATERIVKQ